ncbi:hypothetical protein CC86DRAFT_419116 [Ophiobolus disseminans]|uniref:Uncharacterized protein n=1 Tax=Ophiobolus disseminans TaxID=1469910 RepID=A0A6A6ZY64_9PLEO|nr:hypothetical protein CC86DRAFT_419116 [Ophiobolus disseminans]
MAPPELERRLKLYTKAGKRIANTLYTECSTIFGPRRWEMMVSSESTNPAFILPVRLYDMIGDIKFMVRLRKKQALYYTRKPNKTLKEIESCQTHVYFIGLMESVLGLMTIELRIRRKVEETLNSPKNDTDVTSLESSVLEASVNDFHLEAGKENPSPVNDPMF